MTNKKQVECLAWHDLEGIPEPYRVQYRNSSETAILKIRTLSYEKRQLPDNTMYVLYDCESISYGLNETIKLEYDMGTGKWYMM